MRVPSSQTGRDDAFDELVRAHYRKLCNFVYRYVGSHEVAEDLVQDMFVRILKSDTFDYDDPLPYLYRAARNQASSHLRQQKVRERARDEFRPAASVVTADTEVEYHEMADAVAVAVASLPKRARIIFTMHREQGLSYAEIAHALGIAPKTVENQMGRALRLLRIRLAPYLSIGVTLLSAARVVGRAIF
jgi:RNA polymerase sigma-70 factor (ECF subfamily)